MKPNFLLLSLVWFSLITAAFSAAKTDEDRQRIFESLKWIAEGTIPLE
ncbi:MAG: hypothetical protein K8R87_10170 [Verrucomicrobia bacterium]|nr:hypothetical protein [Verrucomicrobiota bacterium]